MEKRGATIDPAPIRAISLLYHDVVAGEELSSSGFRGRDANIYKLRSDQFAQHLASIKSRCGSMPVILTFDDGGVSCYDRIAPMLEENSLRGIFFIPTDYIGQSGFVSRSQILEMHRRGHDIGSHSCSHPPRISRCKRYQIRQEWRTSVQELSEILGERVVLGSVPGGFYSRTVGEEAASAGIRTLFNSEPTTRVGAVNGCMIRGRFSVQQGMSIQVLEALVSAGWPPRLRQFLCWNTKKALKMLLGEVWLKARKALLEGRIGGPP